MTARLVGISFLTLLLAAGCGGNKNEREGYAFGCPTGMEKKIRSKDALLEAKLEESGDIPYIEVTDLLATSDTEPSQAPTVLTQPKGTPWLDPQARPRSSTCSRT